MASRRVLGRTGFEVAEVSLGAWQIGGRGYGLVTEKDAHATIQAYLDRGGDFIDTAHLYGASERILGDYFQQHGGQIEERLGIVGLDPGAFQAHFQRLLRAPESKITEDEVIARRAESRGDREGAQIFLRRPIIAPAVLMGERQIEIIHPKMIVTLGRYSMVMFFPGKSISKIHGTAQKRDNIIYFAMYHPAAALHQQSLRQTIQEDMLKIPPLLAEAEGVEEAGQEPEQLSMF